jgi:hypothetical protein
VIYTTSAIELVKIVNYPLSTKNLNLWRHTTCKVKMTCGNRLTPDLKQAAMVARCKDAKNTKRLLTFGVRY